MFNFQSRVQRSVSAAFGAGLLIALVATALPAAAWERPHGDGANLNFENVATFPAGSRGVKTVSGLGTFALGAGPVIAADGTVYLGNEQGELIALHADGTPYWRRQITLPQSAFNSTPPIKASPVIGADGTVYVVGAAYARDHRGGKEAKLYESSLHRFTASGGYLGATVFPPQYKVSGYALAAPNIWRFQGKEMVLVPAIYGSSVRLIGFDPSGAVVADQLVAAVDADIHGGSGLVWPGFEPTDQVFFTPPPGVGVFSFAGGGTPFVLVSDHRHDVVGYVFSGGAFVELFRVHNTDLFMRSAPAILPDGHTLIGFADAELDAYDWPVPDDDGGAIFTGPNKNKVAPIKGIDAIYAAPTQLVDGRVLLLNSVGILTILQNNAVATKVDLTATSFGTSVVSPAASQTHVFVSMSHAFITLDANSLTEVTRVKWTGGGVSQPAIGPKGHVYAIASNTLHIFPAPKKITGTMPQPDAPVLEPVAAVDSKPYKPPLTMSGNRLFACEELDGDDCGKGDYDTIATAFCKKEGFVGAGHIKVDSKKVKAETLDGRYCSKKTCKVFEQIICANN